MTKNYWCDPHLRGVKRQLSTYEKDSVPVRTGRALIFPGEPPTRPGDRSEIDELMDIGFDPHRIYGLEINDVLAERLYDHFFDLCPIHWMDVGEFLRTCQGSFCYVHLDFSGQIRADEFEAIQSWVGKIDPIARVRISAVSTKRHKEQSEYENSLRNTILRPLLDSACVYDALENERPTNKWTNYWEILKDSTDMTQVLAVTLLLNFFFGMDARTYSDIYAEKGPFIPQPAGKHRLGNLTRFFYREVSGHYDMVTVWADLIPLVASPGAKESWILGEIDQVMSAIVEPLPQFISQFFSQER